MLIDGTLSGPIVAGDFNGDGKADIASANFLDGSLHMLLGLGNGAFEPGVKLSIGAVGGPLYLADFNGDGRADLAISYANLETFVALGNGDGTFQQALNVLPTQPGASVVGAVADLNGDGRSDLVLALSAANTGINSVEVFLSNGDGTFRMSAMIPVPVSSYSPVLVSDFNGDGHPDLLIPYAEGFYLALGNGDGTFGTPQPTTIPPGNAALAELNGDGRGDVLVANATTGAVSVLTGETSDPITLTISPASPVANVPATLTATIPNASATGTVVFYDGATVLGKSTFSNGQATLAATFAGGVTHQISAFYEGSAGLSSVFSSTLFPAVSVTSGGTFGTALTTETGAVPVAIAVADLNGDGKLDMVTANSGDNTITVAFGKGDGTFSSTATYAVAYSPQKIAIADLNGDGRPDIVTGGASSNTVSIFLNQPGGTFAAALTADAGIPVSAILVGDVNFDGIPDIVVGNTGNSQIATLQGIGNGTFQAAQQQSFTTATSTSNAIAFGDFNGDHKADLVVPGWSILFGSGAGTFLSPQFASGSSASGVAVGDFNGDGLLDYVTVEPGLYNVAVSLNAGGGTFLSVLQSSLSISPNAVVTGDFNGDGKLDLVVTSSNGSAGILLGNGDGTFATEIPVPVGTNPVALAVGDFNGDGRQDIAVANSGSNNVSVLLGSQSACTFTVSPLAPALDNTGGNATITVTASNPDCAWSASGPGGFYTVTASTTVGSGTVTLFAFPNGSGNKLTSTISIAGANVVFTEWSTTQVFTDVPPTDPFFDAIDLFSQKGITTGCAPAQFCPDENVSRAQMAVFIVRSVYGGDNFTLEQQTPYFADVPTTAFGFQWIQKMYELGITTGCGGGDYCPDDSVTRAQMAVFIIKMRFSTAPFTYPQTPIFSDVGQTAFGFAFIQRMSVDGITTGCATGVYCPDNFVTRGEMAVFIMRGAFNALLPPTTPLVTNLTPNTLMHGTTGSFTIEATNVNFGQGVVTVVPPAGITVNSVQVVNDQTLQISLTAADDAPIQPEPIYIQAAPQEVVSPNSLIIQ